MDANLVAPSPLCPKSSFHLKKPSFNTQPFLFPGPVRLRPRTLRATGPSTTTDNGEASMDDTKQKAETTAAPPRPPPTTLNIKYRRRSRNQARQEQQKSIKKPPPPKDWDSMTLGEKAVELYMGEKGLLFWLNKFAYASIFIIIGGWILFRFVGPSIGLYQLDSPPLSPSNMFQSSS